MDSSHPLSDKRYVLVETELADMIEEIDPGDLRLYLRELITANKRHCCYPKGSRITITAPDGTRSHIVGRLRNKQGGFM